ncbi:MAG: LamB/YcsF family protein, partial [Chthoniobacterales bacterium]
MELSIDLNADLGEGAGHDNELLALVSSANIACGLHAGSAQMMQTSMLAARERGVAIGAHPGFDDRENFGRRDVSLSGEEIFALVVYQVGAFQALAHSLGMHPQHVKPHGALYNMAVRNEEMADAIVRAVKQLDSK